MTPANADTAARPEDHYPSIIDYVNALFRWRNFIFRLVFTAGVFMVVYSLIMPKTFKSTAVIMPTQQEPSGGAIESITGQLLGLGIGTGATEIYLLMAILDSRTLAENIIRKYTKIKRC